MKVLDGSSYRSGSICLIGRVGEFGKDAGGGSDDESIHCQLLFHSMMGIRLTEQHRRVAR